MTGKKRQWTEQTLKKYAESRRNVVWTSEGRQHLSNAQKKRFEKQEQRDMNRRAGELGYWSKKKKGFTWLVVLSCGGRVKLIYASTKTYADAANVSWRALYAWAKRHPGIPVKNGKLKGLSFVLVPNSDKDTYKIEEDIRFKTVN